MSEVLKLTGQEILERRARIFQIIVGQEIPQAGHIDKAMGEFGRENAGFAEFVDGLPVRARLRPTGV